MISYKRILRPVCRYYYTFNLFQQKFGEFSCGNVINKFVFISESNDIFVNLALEEWLYQNYNFSESHILLLWRNVPAVVVGRHQNPWLEANITKRDGSTITLARRNSGGGAVYHDLENLNLSFLTSRDSYNRKHNLEAITRSLGKEWGILCDINERDDLTYKGLKISGTASKLSKNNAYHHCTLLVDCDRLAMSTALNTQKAIVTNATRSKPAAVTNLRDINFSVNVHRLMTVIGLEYLNTNPYKKSRKNYFLVSQGFHLISPEEKYYPGIEEIIGRLRSWDWIYARTPKFIDNVTVSVSDLTGDTRHQDLINIEIRVENGVVRNIDVKVPSSFLAFVTSSMMQEVTSSYCGDRYSREVVTDMKTTIINFFMRKFEDCRLISIL